MRNKLGRLPRTFDQRVPHLSSLRLMGSIQLPALPNEIDNAIGLPADLGIMLNDRLGDCLIGETLTISPGLIKAYRVPYDGPVVSIETSTGKRLTTTRNHAVLTSRGFVAAYLLNKGDYVISSDFPQTVARGMDDNFKDIPARIEDVFKSFQRVTLPGGVERQVCNAIDFHGDAIFFKSKIDVVNAYGFLESSDVPAFRKPECQQSLVFSAGAPIPFDRSSSSNTHNRSVSASATGGVGFFSERSFLFRSPPVGADLRRLGSRPHLYAGLRQNTTDGSPTDPHLPSDLIGRFPGEIAADQIIGVEHGWFTGHVYDLSTASQWYIANGIITHNCTSAGAYHAVQVWTQDAAGAMLTEPDAMVEQFYSEATGFNPADPSTDQGGNEQAVLTRWLNTGLPMADGSRSKLSAFVEVDPRNLRDVCEAIYECGVVYIGFSVPELLPEDPGALWDGFADLGQIEGGHCVVLTGFSVPSAPTFDVISWGSRYTMNQRFFQRYVDEVYALASPLWINAAGRTPWGIDPATLAAIMQGIKETS